MLNSLVSWAVSNRFVVLILTLALVGVGGYAFTHINVEAYPDPAPAIIEVVAQFPGASAEEVERQVTIPLEVSLAGMPGLDTNRSKSLFGLSHIAEPARRQRAASLLVGGFEVASRLDVGTRVSARASHCGRG